MKEVSQGRRHNCHHPKTLVATCMQQVPGIISHGPSTCQMAMKNQGTPNGIATILFPFHYAPVLVYTVVVAVYATLAISTLWLLYISCCVYE